MSTVQKYIEWLRVNKGIPADTSIAEALMLLAEAVEADRQRATPTTTQSTKPNKENK